MGLLGNVLKQLDQRPSCVSPTASLADESVTPASQQAEHSEKNSGAGVSSAPVPNDESFGMISIFLPAATGRNRGITIGRFSVPDRGLPRIGGRSHA